MSSIDSTGSKNNVYFAEETNSSRFGRKAIYKEPEAEFQVDVEYDHGTLSPTPFNPYKVSDPFIDRDSALRLELDARGEWYKNHFASYSYEWGKFTGKDTDVQLAYANYSAKPAYNFTAQMIVTPKFAEQLGIQDYGKEHRKLRFSNTWHHNGLPSYQFTENGEVKTLHDTVTASNDRTAYKISMMRRVDSAHDGKSVVYTGRPDTVYKAIEQVEFLFRSEMAKPKDQRQGITEREDGHFELTYVVHNLMSSMKILGKGATGIGSDFDEAESIEREKEILELLEGLVLPIDGKKICINPIYFNQGISALNDFGTPELQKKINAEGDAKLFKLASKNKDPLVQSAVKHLKQVESLLPEEEYFYRDLLSKLLGLPEVVHCKSSTDRTILMAAISMATKEWMNLGLDFPKTPHEVLKTNRYKELYLSNVLSGHQVTRISRSAEGKVKGAEQFSQIIGYEWGTNSFTKNYVALRMLPERFSQEGGNQPPQISIALKVLKFVNKLFGSKGISQRISYLERAYIDREFKSDFFLTKPKGMKMYYDEKSVNPHKVEKKEKGGLGKLKIKVGRFAMGMFGLFSTLSSIPSLLLATKNTDG